MSTVIHGTGGSSGNAITKTTTNITKLTGNKPKPVIVKLPEKRTTSVHSGPVLYARRLASANKAIVFPADPSWYPAIPGKETELEVIVNAHRVSMGLLKLVRNSMLTESAEWKARHTASSHPPYLAHDDPFPPVARGWNDRITDSGFDTTRYGTGENGGYAFLTAQDIFNAWMSDSGHRSNLENPSWTVFGSGCAILPSGDTQNVDHDLLFWWQDYGAGPTGGDPPPPVTVPPATTSIDVWVDTVLDGLKLTTQQYKGYIKTVEGKKWVAWTKNPHSPVPILTSPWGKFLMDTANLIKVQ